MRKVLCILGKDMHNKPSLKIYKEFVSRNINVDVYAIFTGREHIGIFVDEGIKIHEFRELQEEKLNDYDYIFTTYPLSSYKMFRQVKKYIFTYVVTYFLSNCFCNDFNFLTHEIKNPMYKEEKWAINEINIRKMKIGMISGGPHFEGLYKLNGESRKTVLFIDSGHFPFGTKRKLADFLINLANKHSDLLFRIKPRYLPGDQTTTHRNDEYLFDEIYNVAGKELPANLELIKKHTDLRDELKTCNLVICTHTNSFIEAALAKKRILILKDFPSEDNYEFSERRLGYFYKMASESGCLINYSEIDKYILEGLECDQNFLEKYTYKTEGVCKDIVDAMEYIYENFLRKNKFPEDGMYFSENYKDKIAVSEKTSWSDVIKKRYMSMLYSKVGDYEIRFPEEFDMREIYFYLESIESEDINDHNFQKYSSEIQKKMYKIVIDNYKKFNNAPIYQSILLDALYHCDLLDLISEDMVLCRDYYAYVMGKVTINKGEYHKGIQWINTYFSEIENHRFNKTLADLTTTIASAFYFKGVALFFEKYYLEAKENFEKCEELLNGTHIKANEFIEKINDLIGSAEL